MLKMETLLLINIEQLKHSIYKYLWRPLKEAVLHLFYMLKGLERWNFPQSESEMLLKRVKTVQWVGIIIELTQNSNTL